MDRKLLLEIQKDGEFWRLYDDGHAEGFPPGKWSFYFAPALRVRLIEEVTEYIKNMRAA